MNPDEKRASLLARLVELAGGSEVIADSYRDASVAELSRAIAAREKTAKTIARRGRFADDWKGKSLRLVQS